jgi:TPR repeat protein
MKIKSIIIIAVLLSLQISAQDSTNSEAFRFNFKRNLYPLIKPKYTSYPLMSSYILQKKAGEGDPFAQHELGLRYLLGKGFQADTQKAVLWIKKAVDRDLASAKYNYGILFLNEIGVEWNPFLSFENIKFAAESGMPEAQYVMGIFYTDDLIVTRNINQAKEWFEKSARNNFEPAKNALRELNSSSLILLNNETKVDSSAQQTDNIQNDYDIQLMNLQQDENQIPTDSLVKIFDKNDSEKVRKVLGIADVKSLKDTSNWGLLVHACEQGSPEALLIKGKIESRRFQNNSEMINASESLIKSFRLGSVKALEMLMTLIKKENFFRIIKKQIDENNPKAMFVWASLVALGLDYQLTTEQAMNLLIKSANYNHINSLIELGLCYYNGNLVEKNVSSAKIYWQKAIELGSMEAKVRLAFLEIQSAKENSEKKKTVNILMEAANSGSVLAQAYLGYCYENGIGIRKQKSEAERLYRLAAKRGNQAAYNSLKRMYDELRPESEEFKLY